MFAPFSITAPISKFDGDNGWYYVPFDEADSASFRPLVSSTWPALLKVRARIDDVTWTATVMPIKDGPLFIALTAPVRKRLGLEQGQEVTVRIEPV